MGYKILFTKQAVKDVKLLTDNEKKKLKAILTEIIASNPYQGKKLVGELKGNYAYRLTIKDRIIYSIDEKTKTVFIKRTRTHYGE